LTLDEITDFEVLTHDGYRAFERPRALIVGGARYEVSNIEQTWIETGVETDAPVLRVFVVRCEGGSRFRLELCNDTAWRVYALAGLRLIKPDLK
jgi:hypothetical protein